MWHQSFDQARVFFAFSRMWSKASTARLKSRGDNGSPCLSPLCLKVETILSIDVDADPPPSDRAHDPISQFLAEAFAGHHFLYKIPNQTIVYGIIQNLAIVEDSNLDFFHFELPTMSRFHVSFYRSTVGLFSYNPA